jgi:hypothetical protein
MSIIWDLVSSLASALPFEKIVERPHAPDYRNDPAHEQHFEKLIERNRRFSDPIYKKNVQDLIERNRRFEKEE